MNIFGLIGKNIEYSFSKNFFEQKFKKENIKNCVYKIFDIKNLKGVKNYIINNKNIKGLNVTIPYKEKILKIVDEVSKDVKYIQAVNTLKIIDNKIIGYNTDIIGFEKSFINKSLYNKKALILGSGGASKAVAHVLNKHKIKFLIVSRNNINFCSYNDINKNMLNEYKIIINTTPVGTFPDINKAPNIPFDYITQHHYLYDLIYNPKETLFLKNGKKKNAKTKNGLSMLHIQATESWKIWNNDNILK